MKTEHHSDVCDDDIGTLGDRQGRVTLESECNAI